MTRRKGGLYLPLDVEFFENDKVLDAGEPATYLYLAMCCKAKRLLTDGVLSTKQVERLLVRGWQGRMRRLVEVGLVGELEGERWWIVAWLSSNDPAEVVQERRRRDAERKRGTPPNGVQSDSGATPIAKRSREKIEVSTCPHGAAVDNCALCRRGLVSVENM